MNDLGLLRSVERHLDEGERAEQVVFMFTRHRWALSFIVIAGAGLLVLAVVIGFEQWSSRVSLALAGAAVAGIATTEYRVLVQTSKGLALLRSSRVRRRATGLVRRLPADTEIAPIGTNLVITDYLVDGTAYSVMRRYQRAMTAIADQ